MKKTILANLLLFSLINCAVAGDMKLKGMGGMQIAVPDVDAQINLYRQAANIAGLLSNDSTNWMRVESSAKSNWGDIKRRWDADRYTAYNLSFYGQKHLDSTMLFYGRLDYGWDQRIGMNQAIEPEPYALDPFVLTDSTKGNITFYGPRVYAAFSQRIFPRLSWGVSLDYRLSQGLKDLYTMPEIISRRINASLDVLFQLTAGVSLGLSFRPYHYQDNTKLENLPDKSLPITYRYRGEYEFRKHVGGADRHAEYFGYEFEPQFAYKTEALDLVVSGRYYYQWHELYDNPAKRLYDGYYQGQHYYLNAAGRYLLGEKNQTAVALQIKYGTISDWAKHPENDLVFYEGDYERWSALAGLSHIFEEENLQVAMELQYDSDLPDRKDYLAQVYRVGKNETLLFRGGLNFNMNKYLALRGGFVYRLYREHPDWQYFGDYEGPTLRLGAQYNFKNYELTVFGAYGRTASEFKGLNHKQNEALGSIQLKRYF